MDAFQPTGGAVQIGKRPDAVGKTILAIVPSFAERYLSTTLFLKELSHARSAETAKNPE
jgi:hypothetical protein